MLYRDFEGFCVREYFTSTTVRDVYTLFGECVTEGDLHMVCGCHTLAQALLRANERIQCGYDCEIWTCDRYLNERDMLLDRNECKDLV